MILNQVTSEGLAHYSYYIGAGRAAAVIDPRRDCEIYLEMARQNDQKITSVFETHRNEDYVSGSYELSARCGADIYHGGRLAFSFGKAVKEGDIFSVGELKIKILETPGHTIESISLVVTDPGISPGPCLVFTGDALFAGDVGRTDLFGEGKGVEAAGLLYDSIMEKILPLGEGVLVYPAHGAGSVCGGEITDHPVTTIGYEQKTNPALVMDKGLFVNQKAAEHHYLPPYFRTMEALNLKGAPPKGHLPDITPFTPKELKDQINKGVQILDVRAPTSFAAGHIEGSLCIWRAGLPSFMGWFLNYQDPVILIDDFNLDLTLVTRHFVRLGYDNLSGYLAGGFPSWSRSGGQISQHSCWSVHNLMSVLTKGHDGLFLLDVRDIHNRENIGHIRDDHHVYVGEIPRSFDEIPRDAHVVVYCDAGYKGCLAASILEKSGYKNVTNVLGGMSAWVAAGYPVEK